VHRVVAAVLLVLVAAITISIPAGPSAAAAGGWSLTPAPSLPADDYANPFGISCPSVGNCVAVGTLLILTESGGVWSVTETPSLASLSPPLTAPTDAILEGVSCASIGNCVAVGYYDSGNSGATYALILTESNGTWSATQEPPLTALPPGLDGQLFGVSCTSVGDCVAVGGVNGGNPFILTESNGTWSATQEPAASDNSGYTLYGVSCTSVANCVAVGSSDKAGTDPLILTDSSGTWSDTPPPSFADLSPPLTSGSGGDPMYLYGVSCTSDGNCVAVGSYYNRGPLGTSALTLTESSGTWSATQMPSSTLSSTGVSCTSVGNCVAVGNYGYGSDGATPILTASAGIWSPTQTPYATDFLEESRWGISCPSVSNCVAIGGLSVESTNTVLIYTQSPGDANFYGSMGGQPLNKPIVGMAYDPATGGYWEVASDGGLFAFNAPFYGSMGGKPLNSPIVGMAYDPATGGYWEVASDGGLFAFNAPFYGSMGGKPLNSPIVGMAYDSATDGYWEVASDGGLFAFNAPFEGSMGGRALNKPIVGMAYDSATGGYWEVASDGGLFAFSASFYGSMGGQPLNKPIVGMAASADGGYWEVASDGGIFNFNAGFYGSMGGSPLNKPIVGMAATADGEGYWEVASDGGLFAF
jgi:hypothetical protein